MLDMSPADLSLLPQASAHQGSSFHAEGNLNNRTQESVTDIPWESVPVSDGLQDPFKVEMIRENKENLGSF